MAGYDLTSLLWSIKLVHMVNNRPKAIKLLCFCCMAKFDFSDPFLIFVENVTDTDSPLREKFRNVETFQIRGKIDPKVLSGEKLCADMENIVQ